VRAGATRLPENAWFKLCQAFEQRQEYDRALFEYQEFASTHPQGRQGLMALLAAARLAANKLHRPQLALELYQTLVDSPVPHLDLEPSIEMGMSDARIALARSARQESAPPLGAEC
jgi:hypothetical protein